MRNHGVHVLMRRSTIMTGAIYSDMPSGQHCSVSSAWGVLEERPKYFVFNGAVGTWSRSPLKARSAERVLFSWSRGRTAVVFPRHVENLRKVLPRLAGSKPRPLEGIRPSRDTGGRASAPNSNTDAGKYTLVDPIPRASGSAGLLGILRVEGSPNRRLQTVSEPGMRHDGQRPAWQVGGRIGLRGQASGCQAGIR